MSPKKRDMGRGRWDMGARLRALVPCPMSHVLCPPLLFVLSSCSWFTDFKQQPKLDPWETPSDSIAMRGNPQGSVPIYGSAAPGFAYGRAQSNAAVDSMSSITNPVAADERSVRNGGQLFQINCAVCHGPSGAGDGPVARFRYPSMPIGAGSKAATQYSDGYIFGVIRNGRGLMPPYNRIEEAERWDVINYLRAIQSGTANATTVRIGRPGETGDLVPGASQTAPTRPAPYYRPASAAPAAPAVPAGSGAPVPTPATVPPRTP
jgi:mono/diheme cytochrome c family protein